MASSSKPTTKAADQLAAPLDLLAPGNNPLISLLGWKALIDTGGLSAVRGAGAFARDMLSKPRVPVMVSMASSMSPVGVVA